MELPGRAEEVRRVLSYITPPLSEDEERLELALRVLVDLAAAGMDGFLSFFLSFLIC